MATSSIVPNGGNLPAGFEVFDVKANGDFKVRHPNLPNPINSSVKRPTAVLARQLQGTTGEADACKNEARKQLQGASLEGTGRRDSILWYMDEIEIEPVEWLDVEGLGEGYLSLGQPSMCDGYPFASKSTLSVAICAYVSRIGGASILLSNEDHPNNTIKPRVEAAGADMRKVALVKPGMDEKGNSHMIKFPEDVNLIREAFQRIKRDTGSTWGFICIDPIVAYMGSSSKTTDTHKDADVRQVLDPIIAICQEENAAALVLRHFNKGKDVDLLLKGGGSIGFQGVFRTTMSLVAHPDDEGMPDHEKRRVVIPVGSNVGQMPTSKVFRVESASLGKHRGRITGKEIEVTPPKVIWMGDSPLTKDSYAAQTNDQPTKADLAKVFLKVFLADGPRAQSEVEKAAQQYKEYFSWKTLQREAGPSQGLVKKRKVGAAKGGTQKHFWALSEQAFSREDGTSFFWNQHVAAQKEAGHVEPDGHVKETAAPYHSNDGHLKEKSNVIPGQDPCIDMAIPPDMATPEGPGSFDMATPDQRRKVSTWGEFVEFAKVVSDDPRVAAEALAELYREDYVADGWAELE